MSFAQEELRTGAYERSAERIATAVQTMPEKSFSVCIQECTALISRGIAYLKDQRWETK